MRARKFSAVVAAATAVVIMLTGCGEGEQSSNAVNSESSAMSGEITTVATTSSADSSLSSENVIDSNVGDFSYDIGTNYDGSTCAKITGYHGTATDVTLPVTEYQGYNVTVIGTEAFKDSTIKRMVIPEGYKAFEYGAFNDCTELAELYLPDSMEDYMKSDYLLASEEYKNCMKLTKVHFMEYTFNIREELIHNKYDAYQITANFIGKDFIKQHINAVKSSKNGTFAGTSTIPVYFGDTTGSDENVKLDLSNVDLDISGVDADGNEWTSEKFFNALKTQLEALYPDLEGYVIIVIKDGECTQVAYSDELDITKYKEITDEDYTDKYCIGDAVVAKWDY